MGKPSGRKTFAGALLVLALILFIAYGMPWVLARMARAGFEERLAALPDIVIPDDDDLPESSALAPLLKEFDELEKRHEAWSITIKEPHELVAADHAKLQPYFREVEARLDRLEHALTSTQPLSYLQASTVVNVLRDLVMHNRACSAALAVRCVRFSAKAWGKVQCPGTLGYVAVLAGPTLQIREFAEQGKLPARRLLELVREAGPLPPTGPPTQVALQDRAYVAAQLLKELRDVDLHEQPTQ